MAKANLRRSGANIMASLILLLGSRVRLLRSGDRHIGAARQSDPDLRQR